MHSKIGMALPLNVGCRTTDAAPSALRVEILYPHIPKVLEPCRIIERSSQPRPTRPTATQPVTPGHPHACTDTHGPLHGLTTRRARKRRDASDLLRSIGPAQKSIWPAQK